MTDYKHIMSTKREKDTVYKHKEASRDVRNEQCKTDTKELRRIIWACRLSDFAGLKMSTNILPDTQNTPH